ncbi:MAG: hypothetical protein J6A77_05785 [Lachnospiraceae bacterium]|nr:hypothetical protein [Lachnospiraceae bacterium]
MREQKVLVIAIDPHITNPVTGNQEKASEYLGFSLDLSVSTLKQFIEYGSYDEVQIKIVDTMHLNEFPKYTEFASMTEEQFMKLFPVNQNGKGEWYDWWTRNKEMQVLPAELDTAWHFDYSYLIDKCDLINLRKERKFDMVWVFGIDPLSMYESAMIGESPFWINGGVGYADCENFAILGMTFSRPDGALENFCHMSEAMLNYTYGVSQQEYRERMEFNDFSELNTWQKFYLCQHNSPADNTVYGVGQVHFSPNSTRDYEWQSQIPVQSYHQTFLEDYPNITNKNVTTFTAGEYLKKCEDDGFWALIQHHLWWLRHMPHYEGRDENGYLHNWWEYILDFKYVTGLSVSDLYDSGKIRIPLGESIEDISFVIKYNTKETVETTVLSSGAILKCEEKENNLLLVSDGTIFGRAAGTGKIVIMYDGHALEYVTEVY